ncbi:methionine adenosyltransferase [Trichormus variabilis ATCC 29413]|uniref:Methionine adenosyltransferase n=2 Tax=Anabaena variabilis TaxID=264691 RepID=Q3M3E0_TRIV2|nr:MULTISPECIES: methionine adenosyltransferase [Nostocaceae]ABA24496.1 methionine adenosyltransferase [Trichormus variabilis ATCC 29413]MBC1212904.1 methionine adenosyltransferase [Trichormus variabilis ARAD]MBC1256185.1 methionine adenosyltransferase [Trichormus variabilis V5]MBC1267213.1 methionine adenosyltransferase [Trichormus variabilis FSR]MBC1301349.1 methionine adenosyltransferase [Trichormus variabilis N2B]
MKKDFMFTSESVTEGHPDKLCDQISDAIVDRFLQQDPYARVITECAASTGIVFIAARFEPNTNVDFTNIARQVIDQVGYEQTEFNGKNCSILTSLKELSPNPYHLFNEHKLSDAEIEQITVTNQATVFGFACHQTPTLMPLPIWLAHKLARQISEVRRQNLLSYLTPDGKTQVGVEYKNRRPYRIHSITVIASQNKAGKPDLKQLQDDIRETVIYPVFDDEEIKPDEKTRIFINPDGPFIVGGPAVHSGLTGRKNAIDTYGEYSKHSGSALSGKDPIRIDRVGAYVARYAAKNIVAANLADECEVQLSYSIGLARPVSVQAETFGTGKISDEDITVLLEKHFDFRLAGILKEFNLRHLPSLTKGGFYRKLAAYGHVGRQDIDLPWEKIDKVGLF